MTYFSSAPPVASAHDQCRRYRPRTLGQEHRRIRAGQEPAPAFHPRRQQGARAGRAISPRPRASSCRRNSPRRLPIRACRRCSWRRRIRCMSSRFPRWRRPASRSGARSRWRSRAREAERAVAACAKAGVPFALGNNKRCFSSMRELKRVVAEGRIGEVLHIEGNFTNEHSTRVIGGWRDDPRESPGGGMTGAGLHVIDAFVNLAGPIAKVDAQRVRAEGAARSARCRPPRWCNSRAAPPACWRPCAPRRCIWRIHVFGTKGWAEARDETTLTRRADRASSRRRKSFRRSTRSACCWRRSPKPSRPASRSRSRPTTCSTSSAPSRRSSAR